MKNNSRFGLDDDDDDAHDRNGLMPSSPNSSSLSSSPFSFASNEEQRDEATDEEQRDGGGERRERDVSEVFRSVFVDDENPRSTRSQSRVSSSMSSNLATPAEASHRAKINDVIPPPVEGNVDALTGLSCCEDLRESVSFFGKQTMQYGWEVTAEDATNHFCGWFCCCEPRFKSSYQGQYHRSHNYYGMLCATMSAFLYYLVFLTDLFSVRQYWKRSDEIPISVFWAALIFLSVGYIFQFILALLSFCDHQDCALTNQTWIYFLSPIFNLYMLRETSIVVVDNRGFKGFEDELEEERTSVTVRSASNMVAIRRLQGALQSIPMTILHTYAAIAFSANGKSAALPLFAMLLSAVSAAAPLRNTIIPALRSTFARGMLSLSSTSMQLILCGGLMYSWGAWILLVLSTKFVASWFFLGRFSSNPDDRETVDESATTLAYRTLVAGPFPLAFTRSWFDPCETILQICFVFVDVALFAGVITVAGSAVFLSVVLLFFVLEISSLFVIVRCTTV